MSKTKGNSSDNNDKIAYFRARLKSQTIVIFITLTLTIERVIFICTDPLLKKGASKLLTIAIPFLFALCVIVIVKYILFRKMRDQIIKYADYIDLLFCGVFTAEWVLTTSAQVSQIAQPGMYSLATLINYGALGWRTLLQLLISPHWQVRIIGPIAVWIFILQYGVRHDRSQTGLILSTGLLQISYIILIFYFESKINFILTLGNIHRGQWLKLNEFMLNNLSENIAILDLKGKCKFISQNLQKVINKRGQEYNEIEQFLQKIKDIQWLQQETESDSESSVVFYLFIYFSKLKRICVHLTVSIQQQRFAVRKNSTSKM